MSDSEPSNRNPYTGATYDSQADVDKDVEDHPWCKKKIEAFVKRLGLRLSHKEISQICGIWGCTGPEEFFKKMESLDDEQLLQVVYRVRNRKRKTPVDQLVYAEAGVA